MQLGKAPQHRIAWTGKARRGKDTLTGIQKEVEELTWPDHDHDGVPGEAMLGKDKQSSDGFTGTGAANEEG
jgi:hypothetical protein